MKAVLACGVFAVLAVATVPASAQVAYSNFGTNLQSGVGDANDPRPIIGDSLTLAKGGTLSTFGCAVSNMPYPGNAGSVLAGTMVVKFYDNTIPYVAGDLSLQPLLGSATLNWDFTGLGGMPVGTYFPQQFDMSSFNITLPTEVLVTQQFTMTAGTSTRQGSVFLSAPTVGSSSNKVYMKSASVPEGLYNSPPSGAQVAYHIEVVPAPGAATLLGVAGLLAARRRRG